MIKILLLLLVIFSHTVSLAIGLGEIQVHSYLNEPLHADIVITGVDRFEFSGITAELASVKDFARAGIPRVYFLNNLKFEVKKINEDLIVVHITTEDAVKQAFLDFLVQLSWPDGVLVKGYTILLDPQTQIYDLASQAEAIDQLASQESLADSQIGSLPNNTFSPKTPALKNIALAKNNLSKKPNTKQSTADSKFIAELPASPSNEILENSSKVAKQEQLAQNLPAAVHSMAVFSDPDPDEMLPTTKDSNEEVIDLKASQQPAKAKSQPRSAAGNLHKVVSSLHAFSENSKKHTLDYEKLLDLDPNVIPLNKEEEQIVENATVAKLNAELEQLRNKDPGEKIYYSQVIDPAEVTVNVTNNYLELIKKYGNDLLLAFFLVSATIFLFYKMIYLHQTELSSELVMDPIEDQHSRVQRDRYMEQTPDPQVILQNSISSKVAPKHASIPVTLQAPAPETAEVHPEFGFLENEELELKIALAKHYLEAGDRFSAMDLLQSIGVAHEPKYREEIVQLLQACQ